MPRARLPLFLLVAILLVGHAEADEPTNLSELATLPREQRTVLWENLQRFDSLPSAEQKSIRSLDASLGRLEPTVQSRYRVLLRRYHVWLRDLPEDKKKLLAAAGSIDAKLNLIDSWRKADREQDTRSKTNLVMLVHPGDLGTIPPFEMANALRSWLALNAEDRARVQSIEPIPMRLRELNRLGSKNRLPMPRFPEATEDALLARFEADDKVKAVFPNYLKRKEKVEPKVQVQGLKQPLHHLTESLYFIEHPASPVDAGNLHRFEAEIPNWLRASLDPLPPSDARRRLQILYRQIYPPPTEIPPPIKANTVPRKESFPTAKPVKPGLVAPL